MNEKPTVRIAEFRCKAGLSQVELAAKANVSVSLIEKIESGKIQSPGLVMMKRIVEALGTTLDEVCAV
jgi:predicted transcriptional regulator